MRAGGELTKGAAPYSVVDENLRGGASSSRRKEAEGGLEGVTCCRYRTDVQIHPRVRGQKAHVQSYCSSTSRHFVLWCCRGILEEGAIWAPFVCDEHDVATAVLILFFTR